MIPLVLRLQVALILPQQTRISHLLESLVLQLQVELLLEEVEPV